MKEKTMRSKLAGRLQLSEMISQHLDATREKLAAADEKGEKDEKKVEKLVKYEKKEHGGKVPSVEEEKAEHEKKGSFDPHDPEHVEKLASALEDVSEKLAADSTFIGGEATQGGMVLPTMSRVPGKQSTTVGKAKHQVPTNTGLKATKDNPGAATAVPTDDDRAPGGTGAKYPAKGVLKTAGQSVLERIEAAKAQATGEVEEVAGEEKQASAEAVDFILGKIAESTQGGETLDSKSGEGPKPPSQPGRQLISSNSAPASATKREAKAARKAELKQVLTEPAQTKATDKVVSENLRNADKGGVKIAAVRAFLNKVAEEGCTCGGASECRNCKLKTAVAAKKAAK